MPSSCRWSGLGLRQQSKPPILDTGGTCAYERREPPIFERLSLYFSGARVRLGQAVPYAVCRSEYAPCSATSRTTVGARLPPR